MIERNVCILFISFILINQLFTPVLLEVTFLDNPENIRLYRLFRIGIYKLLGSTSTSERLLKRAKELNTTQKQFAENVSFPCDVKGWRSDITPTSVNRLKPGDIDIIASMGDSLSSGAGIFGSNIFQVLIDNRGIVAAGGGQDTWRKYLTLPNILKEFNPNLYGYATGDSSTLHKASKLNVAEVGGISSDMPYMASVLIKRLKSDPQINMQKHWKHISLMIGGNDFCLFMCTVPTNEFLANHERDIVETLRILRDNVPRTFVSLIIPPHLKTLVDNRLKGRPSLYCELLNDFSCPCLFGYMRANKRQEYYKIMERWQEIDIKVSRYPEFQKDDFAVVAQPVLKKLEYPTGDDGYKDPSYFTIDCFHASQKSNSLYAVNLWNNLITPYKDKAVGFITTELKCPTKENPYLFTYNNEGLTEDSK
ncbi:PREDICTED: phospholipase B1, membrane-associated-like [Polistes dominula]|uniref:Phospholipase B1, membrane-associated-like n=1 Tax=Polistes dominula TaxID=743375 RepID=A0ABM1IN76_POLDO|nr:PREDICTED: phospholipase B1, membrane-associated-like [Polistes dominula]